MTMDESVATVLERRVRAGLVGRAEELALLHQSLEADGPIVTAIHGIAGVGKSTLLDAHLADARAGGATVVHLDGRTFEPTESGFLRELSNAVGAGSEDRQVVINRLSELGGPVVLAIDTYEVLRLLESWLRLVFVPRLGANVRLILATREDPFGWSTGPAGLFRAVQLESLEPRDAENVLLDAGLDHEAAAQINRVARGHPLALTIAAAAIRQQPDRTLEEVAPSRIFDALARIYLADLDPTTRDAIEAAAVVRRATVSLLGAMLPDTAPQDAIERLRRLPFVEALNDGLALHETFQAAAAAALHANDPRRYRRLKLAAWRQLRSEVREASRADLWRYTADMLWLVDIPLIREGFFPSSPQHYSVETARPDDAAEIAAIVERHHGPEMREVLRGWWERAPTSFRVGRDTAGHVAGFHVAIELTSRTMRWFADDPIGAAYIDHLRHHPVPPNQRILVAAALLGAETGEAPSAVQAACWLDIKRLYMEMRPALRRIYSGVFDAATYFPVLESVGFVPLPGGELSVDGRTFHTLALDMGAGSVDGWLAWLVGSQLGIGEDDDELLDHSNRQAIVGGRRIDLTKLEFDLMAFLCERRGKAVRRGALLEAVWGYDDGGGSNVVEAAVRSVRRKLGEHGALIETVRGIGYRLRT
jgi:hypothetical protein